MRSLSGVFAWVAEQNRQEQCHADEHGIVEMGNDGDGVELRKSCCDEHLSTIGKESLREAGGGVEDGGGTARVDVETMGNVLSDGACGDDGNGVVGCADIDKTGDGSDAEFSTSFTLNVASECLDDEFDASVVTDDFEHASCQNRDDDEF